MNSVPCMSAWNRPVCPTVSPHTSSSLPQCAEQQSGSAAAEAAAAAAAAAADATAGYDSHKSTKGASKMRRDLINNEIAVLRELLPLPASTRQRLSQLQLMALVCVYVRKANYFQQVFRHMNPDLTPPLGFTKAMNGFLLITCQNGKLLYISENAAEYLGHSMEDLLIHGDSVYDIIDKHDQQTVQNELLRTASTNTSTNTTSGTSTSSTTSATSTSSATDVRHFLCRINVSRNSRRQMRFGDQKLVLVRGQYNSYLPLCSRNEPVFVALCTPVVMPETRECVAQAATNLFTSTHSMDLKFISIDQNGQYHLGYTSDQLKGLSLYHLLHWSSMKDIQNKHKLMVSSDQDRCSVALVRLQTVAGGWLWCHCVLQAKEACENSQQAIIVCTCQILSEDEANIMRNNAWLYQHYSLQGKMSYGYGYEGSGHTSAAYFTHGYGYTATHVPTQTMESPNAITEPGAISSMAYLPNPQPHMQSVNTHMYHQQPSQYSASLQQSMPMMNHQHSPYSTTTALYHQPAYPAFDNASIAAAESQRCSWSRYDQQPHQSSLVSIPHPAVGVNSSGPDPTAQCLLNSGIHTPTLYTPVKRPPTPPESPQQIATVDSLTSTQSATLEANASDPNQEQDHKPLLKRRLIAYHHSHHEQNQSPYDQPGKTNTSYYSPATACTRTTSQSTVNRNRRNASNSYNYFHSHSENVRGTEASRLGSGAFRVDGQNNELAFEAVEDSYGPDIVARPAPIRAFSQTKHRIAMQSSPSTAEIDSALPESANPWSVSPPWSESQVRASDSTAIAETTFSVDTPQTSVTAAIRSLDMLTAEQRLAMTANWADASLMYPFYIATPSPSSGSTEESNSAMAWRDVQAAPVDSAHGVTYQQTGSEHLYSQQQALTQAPTVPVTYNSGEPRSYHTLESRSSRSHPNQL